jgi:hypothetical protein
MACHIRIQLLVAFAAIAAGLAALQAAAAPTAIGVPHEVEDWRGSFARAQHTYGKSHAIISPDATQFVFGRLADRPVAVMLFTLEGVRGPDDWLQYVATFWYRGGNYLFCCVHRVGGKGLQLINELSVEPDRVILAGNTYRNTDAVCCPSRPMTLRLALERRRLIELPSAN